MSSSKHLISGIPNHPEFGTPDSYTSINPKGYVTGFRCGFFREIGEQWLKLMRNTSTDGE